MSVSIVAYNEGLGSCILTVDRGKQENIECACEGIAVALVVALGYPADNSVVAMVKDGDITYWFD